MSADSQQFIMIRGGRAKEGLTQARLAELVRVTQRHISEMENGKRPIGKEMAKRLGQALNVSYRCSCDCGAREIVK